MFSVNAGPPSFFQGCEHLDLDFFFDLWLSYYATHVELMFHCPLNVSKIFYFSDAALAELNEELSLDSFNF